MKVNVDAVVDAGKQMVGLGVVVRSFDRDCLVAVVKSWWNLCDYRIWFPIDSRLSLKKKGKVASLKIFGWSLKF